MSKSGKKRSGSALKPGQKAPRSGIYELVRRGEKTGKQVDVARGKPLPPAPKSGEKYTIRAKSGRYIITSPAQSANTTMMWSTAFKPLSPGTPAPRSGIYEQIGPRGGKTGELVDASRGKPLPPLDRGTKGWTLVKAAHHKSGK